MRFFILLSVISFIGLSACHQQGDNSPFLQHRIDSLQHQLANVYQPGFGEFMSGIQVHHAKLWFAGKNKNWKLADFEIKEIQEALSGIQQYCTDRPETKDIKMLDTPIELLNAAIQQKNTEQFNSGFSVFTTTCNNCHKATGHEFNVITIPVNPPFSNQDFKTSEK